MSDQDPEFTQTTRTTVVEPDGRVTPFNDTVQTRETTVVDRRPSNAAWWVAGLVAVVAIIGVVWMVVAANGGAADAEEIEDAIADARLEGQLEGAQASVAGAAAAADRAAESAARSAAEAVREPSVVVVEQPAAEPPPPPAGDVEVVVETPAG